jgi:hypothetical protein
MNKPKLAQIVKPQPWAPADATDVVRALAKSEGLTVTWTNHARGQMAIRDLIAGDILFVLKNGFVYEEAQESTQPGFYKYLPESRSPNSGNRSVRVVVIPDPERRWMKIVTVMWVDE